jgi:hypothetical protein
VGSPAQGSRHRTTLGNVNAACAHRPCDGQPCRIRLLRVLTDPDAPVDQVEQPARGQLGWLAPDVEPELAGSTTWRGRPGAAGSRRGKALTRDLCSGSVARVGRGGP